MMQAEQDIRSAIAKKLDEELIRTLVAQAIPIYTLKNTNPKSGKPDCPVTTREKEHYRTVMKLKLGAAKTEQERKKWIDHYTKLFE